MNKKMKNEILVRLIPITWVRFIEHGYANGYIGLPEGHPWHGLSYDDIDVSIHGGLTYASDELPKGGDDISGYWWIGFDTVHGGDNIDNCDKAYCEREVENLKKQAEEAWI